MVTLVMPAYNEADIIESAVREWHAEVVARLPGAELIVVDDCSTDETGAVLDHLATVVPALKVVRPARNGGHGRALRLGFHYATQPFVFQTDSDRQHLASEFWELWNVREAYDFVFGVRKTRADGWFRVFITRSMRLLNFIVWGIWVRDANCPFKLMRREALSDILQDVPQSAFIPMVMVSLLSRKMGYRVHEITVTHMSREGGQQSLRGLLKWLRVAVTCAWELARLRLAA